MEWVGVPGTSPNLYIWVLKLLVVLVLLIDSMTKFMHFESNVEDKNEEGDDDTKEICAKISDISFIDCSFIDDELVQTSSNYNFKNVSRIVEHVLEDMHFSNPNQKKLISFVIIVNWMR